jgi:molybdate transport system ATP-binding protein
VESYIPSLVVTHDRTEALSLGDQIVVIEAGKIIQSGPVQAVFNRPAKLSVAGILAVETIQSGEVMSYEAGLAQVRAGTATLLAATLPEAEEQPVAAGRSVYVCIRAEDVVLLRDRAAQTSARNCLPGVIRNLLSEGASVRVEMDCGFPLVALLTKQGCAELNLKKDDTIYALVKAPHVQLISRE